MTTLQYDPVNGVRTIASSNTGTQVLPEDEGPPKILWGGRRRGIYGTFRTFNSVGSLKQSNLWTSYYGYGWGGKPEPGARDKNYEYYVLLDGKWERLYEADIKGLTNKNVKTWLARRKLHFAIVSGDFELVKEAASLLDTAS